MQSIKCFCARCLGKTLRGAGSGGAIQNRPLRIPAGEKVPQLHYCDFSNPLWQSPPGSVTLSPRPSLHLCHFVPRRNSARGRAVFPTFQLPRECFMGRSSVDRRDFMKVAAAGTAALSLTAESYARVAGANGRINVAFLGVGGRCQAHIAIINKLAKDNGVRPV